MRQIIFIILICFAGSTSSQKDPEKLKTKIDSLKKLGRDSLIKLAVIANGDPDFKAEGYDRIVVKVFPDKLIVEFSLSVVIFNGCYYEHVSVALVGNGTSRGGDGYCNELKYHTFTAKEKKKIQFVFDAVNKSDEIGDIKDNKISPGNTMKITEKTLYYYVEVNSRSTYSHYKVDKLTGKISDANHKHYARSHPDEDEKYEVIK